MAFGYAECFALCNAFGITLSQFFLEEEEMEIITKQEKELIALYRNLSSDKKIAILELLKK